MKNTRPSTAKLLIAVKLDGLIGEPRYLQTLPGVHHVDTASDDGLIVWLEDRPGSVPQQDSARPERPPEVELHGQGAPSHVMVDHPRAEHVEMFFDGLGDPEAAPLGWWHARVWLKAA